MEWIITALVSISEAPVHARWQTLHFVLCCWWKKLVNRDHCAQWILWSLFHGSFHHTDIILSNFVITFIWNHDGGQLSFCLPLFIPDSSHFFFPVLVSVISCLSSTLYCTYMAFWSLMCYSKVKDTFFFCSSEHFPFFHFFHYFFNILPQIGMILTSFVWKHLNMGFSLLLLGLSGVNWLYSTCKACIFSVVFFGLIVTM